jgi:hypothetical protein
MVLLKKSKEELLNLLDDSFVDPDKDAELKIMLAAASMAQMF